MKVKSGSLESTMSQLSEKCDSNDHSLRAMLSLLSKIAHENPIKLISSAIFHLLKDMRVHAANN